MSFPDSLPSPEVVVGTVAGLAAIFYAGRIILRNLGLFHNSNRLQGGDRSAHPSSSIGHSQMANRDKRHDTETPASNRGKRPAAKNRRN